MKILVMGFTKLKYMPYANMYLNVLTQHSEAETHLLLWNRDLKEDIPCRNNVVLHSFEKKQLDEASKITKVKSFYFYRKFANKLIRKERFDKIIVLHSLPGVLIADTLLREYPHNYIFDFRDKTVLDIGSSTGGFTEYALEKGAKKVIAIEKGSIDELMMMMIRGEA